MLVEFTLTMEDAVVKNKCYDQIVFSWKEDMNENEVLALSQKWMSTRNFLIDRMTGLTRVGESSLTIEPLESKPIKKRRGK